MTDTLNNTNTNDTNAQRKAAVLEMLAQRKAEIMDQARREFMKAGRGFVAILIDSAPEQLRQNEFAYINQLQLRQMINAGTLEGHDVVKRVVDVYDPHTQAVAHVTYGGFYSHWLLTAYEDGEVTDAAEALDEIGPRQAEILAMSDAEREILAQQLTQRARFYGLNLVAGTVYNLIDRETGQPFDLENMTLFQVEETLDGLTTKEDLEDPQRN